MSKMKVVDPVLKWFWKKCRAKLARPENQRKRGWQENTFGELLHRLQQERAELENAVDIYEEYDGTVKGAMRPKMMKELRTNIINEATDVANFAMMIADKARKP